MVPEFSQVLRRLTETLDTLGIGYFIGGSVASSRWGEERFTRDIDFVARIQEVHIVPLVEALKDDFYIDAEMIQEALDTRTEFNVLYLPTMLKADIFIAKSGLWETEEWARRRQENFGTAESPLPVYVASAEDMILQKLIWYRLGGGVSNSQWRDVQWMLQVQAEKLDFAYLQKWAAHLQLTELLTRAYSDAEISPATKNEG